MRASRLIFTPRVEISLGGTAALLPISLSGPYTARFFNLNARAGYFPPWVPLPWKVGAMCGIYGSWMTASIPFAGYKDLVGPQATIVIQRRSDVGNTLSAYIRYSPTAGGNAGLFSAANREIAAGIDYAIPVREQKNILATFDVSNLDYDEGQYKSSRPPKPTRLSANAVSLGLGYGF